MIQRTQIRRALAALLVLAAAYAGNELRGVEIGAGRPGAAQRQPATSPALDRGTAAIVEAFRERRSDVWVEAGGVVDKVLRDDLEGSRHQRFIVRLPTSHSVLIAHNIDLAPRVVNIARGDSVRFRGEYEYNDRGGVVHWTHHDPRGRRAGGWIEHGDRRYE